VTDAQAQVYDKDQAATLQSLDGKSRACWYELLWRYRDGSKQ
jgi:hypothetical protein